MMYWTQIVSHMDIGFHCLGNCFLSKHRLEKGMKLSEYAMGCQEEFCCSAEEWTSRAVAKHLHEKGFVIVE
jgi:hypothetical protein